MTQASPSDDAQAVDDGALLRLEGKLCLLEELINELLAEEPLSPSPLYRRPSRRSWSRLPHRARLYVITGGLAALFGVIPSLPSQNPARVAVDYTISALVQQLPASIPDIPDLGPVVIGNPDYQHRPIRPLAAVRTVFPELSPPSPPAVGATTPTPSPSTPVEIPLVKAAPVPIAASAQPSALPARVDTPAASPVPIPPHASDATAAPSIPPSPAATATPTPAARTAPPVASVAPTSNLQASGNNQQQPTPSLGPVPSPSRPVPSPTRGAGPPSPSPSPSVSPVPTP